MSKFINSNIGLLFVLTMLVCATGVEAMISEQDFKQVFGSVPPKSNFADDFLKGQMDCNEGKPHKSGMSDAYNRGYATQHEMETALANCSQ